MQFGASIWSRENLAREMNYLTLAIDVENAIADSIEFSHSV